MHTHTHGSESPPQTEGRLIRWALFYDLTVNLMTFGRVRRLRNLTVRHALLKPGESVFDVGCGTGGVTIPAKLRVGKTGDAAGIDPAPEMIAVARRKARHAGLEIDFRIGVIESLPYPDATFDVVTSSLMMHHLPQPLQVKGLAEIRRVLKPGGRILIADMKRPSNSFTKRFFTLLVQHGHAMQFGIEDLPELLKDAGFEEIQQLEDGFLTIGFMWATKPADLVVNLVYNWDAVHIIMVIGSISFLTRSLKTSGQRVQLTGRLAVDLGMNRFFMHSSQLRCTLPRTHCSVALIE